MRNCLLILSFIFLSNSIFAQFSTPINSENAAAIWQKLATEKYPGKQDDITFINELQGWYINGYGRIFRTKDGGKTWEKQ